MGQGADLCAQTSSWKLVEELRIGAVDGGPEALTDISAFVVLDDGSMLVGQSSEGMVKVFDRAGEFVNSFGGSGAGPGEFQSITGLGYSGDTVWVSDVRQARITRFTRDGGLIGVRRVQGELFRGVGRPLTPMAYLLGGRYLATALQEEGDFLNGGRGVEFVVQTDSLGGLAGEFGHANVTGAAVRVVIGSRAVSMIRPLRSPPHFARSGSGEFVATIDQVLPDRTGTVRYAVTLMRSPTDTVFSSTFGQSAVPLDAAAMDSILEERLETLARLAIPEGAGREALVDALELPRFWPAVGRMVVSDGGEVLLGRHVGARELPIQWTVVNASGRIRGSFRAPGDLEILAFDGVRVWAIRRDSLDIPYLYRYRLEAGG